MDDWIDRLFVDGLVNFTARCTYGIRACELRTIQTGNIRQYVLILATGTVAIFDPANLLEAGRGNGESTANTLSACKRTSMAAN